MDLTPERLILQPPGIPNGANGQPAFNCQSAAASPEAVLTATGGAATPNQFACRPHNAAFRNIVSELGFALAPMVMRPARTTGYTGFVVTFDASFTNIHASGEADGVRYWEKGTRGAKDASGSYADRNVSPASTLGVYSLHVRKGLPLGFEAGASLGYVGGTSMWAFGGDLRWAFLEGFRKGPLGYLPDVSVGGGVRTLVGSSKTYLTTVGIDAVISKPFAIADSSKLSPFIGYQRLIVFGNSSIVDLTPNVDAYAQCGYLGPNLEPNGRQQGGPVCGNKLSNGADNNGDFNNNTTFAVTRIHRHRMLFGLAYNYEMVKLGAQFATDITDPGKENYAITGGRQWTLSLDGGVSF